MLEIRQSRSQTRDEYQRLQKVTNRQDPLTHLSTKLYKTLLTSLTGGEVAFNNIAFRVFQESGVFTLVIAIAFGISIPLCAHLIGLWFRQWQYPSPKIAVIKVVILLMVVVGGLVAVNSIRLDYIKTLPSAGKSFDIHRLSWEFLMINLVILAGVIVLTYLTYDPEPGFKEAKQKLDKYGESAAKLESKLNELEDSFRTEVDKYRQNGWALIAYYRLVNRSNRQEVPRYFDDSNDSNYRPEFVEIKDLKHYQGSL